MRLQLRARRFKMRWTELRNRCRIYVNGVYRYHFRQLLMERGRVELLIFVAKWSSHMTRRLVYELLDQMRKERRDEFQPNSRKVDSGPKARRYSRTYRTMGGHR